MKLLLPAAVFILIGMSARAQFAGVPVSEWIKKLKDPEDKNNQASVALYNTIALFPDSLLLNTFVKQLKAGGTDGNDHFYTRLQILEAGVLYRNDFLRSDKASKLAVLQLLKQGMHSAYESGDEYLVAWVSGLYFGLTQFYNEPELCVMYGMYSAELHEKLFKDRPFPNYSFLAEQMYQVREYDKCRSYCLKWLDIVPARETREHQEFIMKTYNTMALAYHRTGRYDSAMYYYGLALAMTEQVKRPDWKGIISGNMGQLFYLKKQYDTAVALLDIDYRLSMQYKYFDNAANALQWSAKANIALGNRTVALQQVREAMILIKRVPDEGYQQNIFRAAVEVFKANNLIDSAMYYSDLYQQLHDAIEKKINASSIAISNVRLNEEKNVYNIRRLQQEKKSHLQQRNFIVSGIILLAVISVLVVNRQRIRFKYRHDRLEREKEIVEKEIASARQQMERFTENIIEKTSLVEKLEQQVKDNNASAGQQEIIGALTNLTILTEQHWDQFKELFEKIYPMFFQRLKTKSPDISLAEQRMAALTRLHLTTKQMASMQGISPDSVHKTRQRLRLRLGITNEASLDEYLANL